MNFLLSNVSFSDLMHIVSTMVVFYILMLYAGEWRLYFIVFLVVYIAYYIYTFIIKPRPLLKKYKDKTKKKKNILKMLQLDVVNIIRPTTSNEIYDTDISH